MPSKSRSQQRLFCMALAVRRGDLKRSDVQQSVLDIVDGDMTNKEIEDFTKLAEGNTILSLADYITESYKYNTPYASGAKVSFDTPKYLFIVIKPSFFKYANTIIDEYEKAGFKLDRTCSKRLTLEEARKLYYRHRKEEYYNRLCKYMSGDVSYGVLFTYTMNTKEAFKLSDEIKDRIRKKYSESEMRNVMHSSDNEKEMRRECSVYFNE